MTNHYQYTGIAASAGYALGAAYVLQEPDIQVVRKKLPPESVDAEIDRLERDIDRTKRDIEALRLMTLQKLGADEADIFAAHIMLLEDPEYISEIKNTIKTEAVNAEAAVQEVTEKFAGVFAAIEDEYIRERAADLQDVSQRLLCRLLGIEPVSLAHMTGHVVLVARELTPSDTTQLNRDAVDGIVTCSGGPTSHSAIMARSMGIPAVVGVKNVLERIAPGDFVIVDGHEGHVFINPPAETVRHYRAKKEKFMAAQTALKAFVQKASVTRDGVRVELSANIGGPHDATKALANGAEGIGLYRTEFLYMGRNQLPSEEEQFTAYQEVAVLFGRQRPVVIRTLDIGGDKEVSYLDLPQETNPFLGYRAIRLCLDRTDIFKTQLRAILRASVYGNVKIMYPMIATLQELAAANKLLEEVKQDLEQQRIPYRADGEVGMMIEVPSAAVLADQFASQVDFFSIGTNDLVQYTMAADRMNERVSYLNQPFHPAVLRLIQGVIAAAHNEKKWVGMCGEMAGDVTAIPVLLGMGLDEFSMNAAAILPARALVCQLSRAQMETVARTVLAMNDAAEIKRYVENHVPLTLELDESISN